MPRLFYPSEAIELAFGHNSIGSGTVYPLFTGHIRHIEPWNPGSDTHRSYGALRCTLSFPEPSVPRSDPLVTTGRNGAGDIIYVTYEKTGLRIGFDHWGTASLLSEIIPIPANTPKVVEISMGSLWPADLTDPAWGAIEPARRRDLQESVFVRIDGHVVFHRRAATYPSAASQIEVGANPIGGSTCEPAFSGSIIHYERVVPSPISPE